MNRALRMALVLSLLMAFSIPALAVTCRTCTEEIGCSVVSQPTDTWCRFVLNPVDCRQISSPGCTPGSGGALMGELSVVSIEMTRPSEGVTIVSNYEPAVAELATPGDAPQK